MAVDIEIDQTQPILQERFRRHRHVEIIFTMSGYGVTLTNTVTP
ncbi:hypothetical protein [Mycobacterium intracellulare]|nr:hypothetical protein [Mycobacterium intracellulare]